MPSTTKSYSSHSANFGGFLRQARVLYKDRRRRVPYHLRNLFQNLHLLESRVKDRFGVELRNLDILDVGCGQFLIQLFYFAQHNRVVGVDADKIAHGFNPLPYLEMLFANGTARLAKTIARKLLGVDRHYRQAIKTELNFDRLPPVRVLRMDACNMSFADESFDLVNSTAVFHHITNPAAAISEAARVLRPGGIAYIAFHLFTSETGSLDPRDCRDSHGQLIRWPHLRPDCSDRMNLDTYVNKLRLSQWRELFGSIMPGAEFIFNQTSRDGAADDAQRLVAEGKLPGYSVEELLVHDVTVMWRKPATGSGGHSPC